ncbi:MAG: class I SAM-dependent methyltransferase [Deltaproteobacteria bacterium]|nr:class I SAM-dependent methyltransferase [Deltaproteobacteria bacterium]
MNSGHYERMLQEKKATRFTRCGYVDRFDPFLLNRVPRLRALYDNLFETFLKGIPCRQLLDIGCGTGIYFDALSGYADHIEAIDLSEDLIQVAKEYCGKTGLHNIRARKGSA